MHWLLTVSVLLLASSRYDCSLITTLLNNFNNNTDLVSSSRLGELRLLEKSNISDKDLYLVQNSIRHAIKEGKFNGEPSQLGCSTIVDSLKYQRFGRNTSVVMDTCKDRSFFILFGISYASYAVTVEGNYARVVVMWLKNAVPTE